MSIEEWQLLSDKEQKNTCQMLNPFEEWFFFKQVEKAFLDAYSEEVVDAFCGLSSGLGSVNSITVTYSPLAKGKLPKFFLGFPVLKKKRISSAIDA